MDELARSVGAPLTAFLDGYLGIARTPLLSIGSALFYTGGLGALKLWAVRPSLRAASAALVLTCLGFMLEAVALKTERLGMIYVTILACEVGLIAAISLVGFGERFSAREALGCLLILTGTVLAWSE